MNHVTLLRKCCSTEPVAQFGGLGTQSDTDDLSTTIHVCENVRCSGPAPMESNEVVTAAVVQDLGLTSSRLTKNQACCTVENRHFYGAFRAQVMQRGNCVLG